MKSTGELVATLQRIHVVSKAKRPQESSTPEKTNVVQLPIWPDVVRGVPNVALRSALFGAIKKGARAYLERQVIHSVTGLSIIYTGARLDQGDLSTWETVLHIVRTQALGTECRATAYHLLKLLGLTDSGINRKALERRLSRMKATGIEVKVGRYSYEGSLIDEVYRDEETREYIIRLNPKLHALFAADQFTQIDWRVRQTLEGHQLAQWAHGFYASHAEPFPLKIETLLKLCGSEQHVLTDFTKKLRKALDAVMQASEAHGEHFAYVIVDGLVHVQKKPSKAQQKHLNKKISKLKTPRT